MNKSHFLDKYNKMLILIKSNEEEDENDYNDKSSNTEYYKRANNFNFENHAEKNIYNLKNLKFNNIFNKNKNYYLNNFNNLNNNKINNNNNLINNPNKLNSNKNFEMDISLENININNVRDLIKNKNEFNKKVLDDFKMENNHSEILVNIDKLSGHNDEISMDAGELLNEINFTESAASTYREKIDRKIGSVIRPTNTFNNRVAQDIEYQLDLEKAKRKQRNKESNNVILNNINSGINRKHSMNNFGNNTLKKENNIINNADKFNNNIINNLQKIIKKDFLLSNSNKKNFVDDLNEQNIKENNKFDNNNDKIQKDLNELKIDDLNNSKNNNIENNDENNNQLNHLLLESEFTRTPNKININFTNYGVVNNNQINYHFPKMNSLNSKMLDLFKEISSTKSKGSFEVNNLNNLINNQQSKLTTNEMNRNNIIDSILNNNLNNLQSSINKNYLNVNTNNNLNNNNPNVNNNINNNLNNNVNNINLQNKEDYFSDLFKSVESKNSIKSLSERINLLKKKNNIFAESNIKGVNNTNNLLNLNSKFSNLDKIFKKNSANSIAKNSLLNTNNNFNNFNNNKLNTANKAIFSKPIIRGGNIYYETGQSNNNNFDILEAQLDSLKKKTTKTKNSINKLNNLIIAENTCINNYRNLDEKINRLNYEKLNQSLEDCENLINNLKESKTDKTKNFELNKNFLNNSNFNFDDI